MTAPPSSGGAGRGKGRGINILRGCGCGRWERQRKLQVTVAACFVAALVVYNLGGLVAWECSSIRSRQPELSDVVLVHEQTTHSQHHLDEQQLQQQQQQLLQQPPSSPQRSGSRRRVRFVETDEVDVLDSFAASWWQSVDRFMRADLNRIGNVEADVWIPIEARRSNGHDDVRMAVDWLDFSVEHLSKWWKMLGNSDGANYAVGKLQSYVLAASHQHNRRLRQQHQQEAFGNNDAAGTSPTSSLLMSSTLAVLPYGVQSDPEVWQAALAATIASLVKQGIARIVVVGHFDLDEELAHNAFEYLGQHYHRDHYDADDGGGDGDRKKKPTIDREGKESYFRTDLASTELVFVHTDDVASRHDAINVPKGALKGIQEALNGTRPDASDWVGENPRSRLKYVFLTESDQILNARLSTDFLDAMDRGRIVIPHRLQPIPHWLDLDALAPPSSSASRNRQQQKTPPQFRMVPRSISDAVVQLDPEIDSCCDGGSASKIRLPEDKTCGSFWWQCGLGGGMGEVNDEELEHLRNYQFIRVSTGIVHLATTEHSRKCYPVQGSKGCDGRSTNSSNNKKMKKQRKRKRRKTSL